MQKVYVPHDIEFESFPKIPRISKALNCVITEKIDGTNAQIMIENDKIVAVGSRSRWIEPGKQTDNYGFSGWVDQNYDELLNLGHGVHYGEWYGNGIQRNYGLSEKRFALFNAGRWTEENLPSCCGVVPILASGEFSRDLVDGVMNDLKANGSKAVPGFMKPEGIIIYMTGLGTYIKHTFEHAEGKWKS